MSISVTRRRTLTHSKEGCPSHSGQPSVNVIDSNNDETDNRLTAIRLQFLISRFGLDPSRSALIAALAFEGGVI